MADTPHATIFQSFSIWDKCFRLEGGVDEKSALEVGRRSQTMTHVGALRARDATFDTTTVTMTT